MRCPNLMVADAPRCVTVDDSYRPSYFQQREYCGGRYAICPFYMGFQKIQARYMGSSRTLTLENAFAQRV
ncbi:MAG: hypothetical protein HZA22_13385 [Nitrospirae bacterium]|nr:hypothetical protein [Nitrospirota bacterium]MBI5694643.1 hypothetical protein [Nitrospirota bacterium]